ncbi:MAG: formyltetrahydrofolate deformylase [Reyranellaceae bacterium]
MSESSTYILSLSCPDRRGIVAAVSGFLAQTDCFITESADFGDPISGRFFQRTVFRTDGPKPSRAGLEEQFEIIARRFDMQWALHDAHRKARLIVMVSKFGHCLNDLLYRYRTGALPIEIAAVVSNHGDFAELVGWHGVPFHHWPVDAGNKTQTEQQLLALVEEQRVDLVVLARYMQILSPELCARLGGRAINIHHSFLPSFKGARPYHQAHARGVKLIGATAHYVTTDLDEGPIIEQAVERIDHTVTPDEMVAIGRDIENVVLARAIKLHVEHRVLINGGKTVVFR